MRMPITEPFEAFNARRAREERARAERAPNTRDRELHLEMASIFERRASCFWYRGPLPIAATAP